MLDTADAFPLDKTETLDTDTDGIGNNADTDDDNDGTADVDDAQPLDAFPWDTELSVAKNIDKNSFPTTLFIATENPDSVWQYGDTLVGRLIGLNEDGSSYYRPNGIATRNVDEDYELGTWSFGTNSVLSSHTLPYSAGYYPQVNRTSSNYSNIDWSAFESAKGVSEGGSAQMSLTLKYDRELWLIDSDASASKYTFYQKFTTSYYVADGETYAVDASLPVRTDDPVYVKLSMYDVGAKSNLPLTAEDLVSGASTTWVMPVGINEKVEGSYRKPLLQRAIYSDLVTFNSDGTGSTKLGGRTFVWEQGSASLRNDYIQITYSDGSIVLVYKFAEGSNHIGVRVVAKPASTDSWTTGYATSYDLAVRQDDSTISIDGYVDKALYSTFGANPSNAFSEKYISAFGLTLNANGTSKTQSSWDLGGEGTGWSETEYIWERAQNTNTLQLYSCRDAGGGGWQDTDSNGVMDTCPSNDYFRFRNVELLKPEANGLWLNMDYFIAAGGTVSSARRG